MERQQAQAALRLLPFGIGRAAVWLQWQTALPAAELQVLPTGPTTLLPLAPPVLQGLHQRIQFLKDLQAGQDHRTRQRMRLHNMLLMTVPAVIIR